jgi:ferritin-like metal-binding protein YciE
MKSTNSLTDLYVNELRDLYSAEQQILKALPKMTDAASHAELRNAFETHRQQTERHVSRLQQIFDTMGESPKGEKCEGVEGIIKEGADLIDKDIDGSVRDAGLIAAAQRVEHYEMAVYGSVRAWAEQLGRGSGVFAPTNAGRRKADERSADAARDGLGESRRDARRDSMKALVHDGPRDVAVADGCARVEGLSTFGRMGGDHEREKRETRKDRETPQHGPRRAVRGGPLWWALPHGITARGAEGKEETAGVT